MNDYTIALSPAVKWNEVDGQTVLFSNATGDFFGVNPTAAHLVKELLNSTFRKTVVKAAADFEVEPEVIATDLQDVINALSEAKLVAVTQVTEPA